MKISEKDIFDFVYYPGNLEEKKYRYIKSNLKKYADLIEFLNETKSNLEHNKLSKQDEDEIYESILEKIRSSNSSS